MTWTNGIRRLFATRADRIVTVVTAVLLVALGYVAGLWTTEARRDIPIVFQPVGDNGDLFSAEDLEKLTEAGRSQERPASSTTAREGEFVASVNGSKYYAASCSEVRRIREENRIWFATEQEARDAGYEPSACLRNREIPSR